MGVFGRGLLVPSDINTSEANHAACDEQKCIRVFSLHTHWGIDWLKEKDFCTGRGIEQNRFV